jgi:hypothetical protein
VSVTGGGEEDGKITPAPHAAGPTQFSTLRRFGAPLGQYLVERRGVWLLLWRLSDGEPPDGALEPAANWALVPA